MFKNPISLAVTVIGGTAFGWAVACSSTDSTPATSGAASGSTSGSAATGSSSGSAATGSSSGSAATGSSSGSVAEGGTDNTVLIDSVAATGNRIALPGGGFWYVYSDVPASKKATTPAADAWQSTSVTPPSGVTSTHAACLTTPPWSGYALGIGFNLKAVADSDAGDAGFTATTFDATPYTGVTFYAMAIGDAGSAPTIKIAFPDDQTHGADPNAACNHMEATGLCDDDFSQSQPLTPTWVKVTINFTGPTAISQNGYGATYTAWDQKHVWGINFQVNGSGPTAATPEPAFGFCLADIRFTK